MQEGSDDICPAPPVEDLFEFMRQARSQVQFTHEPRAAAAASSPYFEDGDAASDKDCASHSHKEGESHTVPKMQWMWADAGLLQSRHLTALAQANPLRWSARLPPGEIKSQLLSQKASRPVTLRICGQGGKLKFSSAEAAAAWIDDAAQDIESQTQHPGFGNLGVLGCVWMAPAACTYFLRTNAKTTWRQKNVFVAASYARRITHLPYKIAHMQEFVDTSPHKRRMGTYEEFDSSEAKALLPFIDAVSILSMTERPRTLQVGGKEWMCVENAPYWMGWLHTQTAESVIAFRGGDGGKDDACNHPGSPVRAFICGQDERALPELPVELLRSLSETATEARKNNGTGGISLVGYSQGGVAALASALLFGTGRAAFCQDLQQDTLKRVELLNCATMFWPTWYATVLPEDWWSNAPAVSCKITSWVVKDDPLSEGLQGSGGFRAPSTPGATIILPAKYFDKDILHNHDLSNFK